MRPMLSLAFVALLLATSGCAVSTVMVEHERASQAWVQGKRQESLRLAEQAYHRFRRANELSEDAISQTVNEGLRQLEEVPTPPTTVGPAVPEGGATSRSQVMDQAIQEDLLSLEVTACFRAIHSVQVLGLERHVPGLIAVIFQREPWTDGPGPLAGTPTPMAALALKHLALDTFRRLLAPPGSAP